MQVSIETTTGLERRLTITVPAARVDSEVNAASIKQPVPCVWMVFVQAKYRWPW
jgi:hypothetical protein